MGERVLCKHEVIGSIPFASTTLRRRGCAFIWSGSFKGSRDNRVRGPAVGSGDREPGNFCPGGFRTSGAVRGHGVRTFC